jgi:hypothetical protein
MMRSRNSDRFDQQLNFLTTGEQRAFLEELGYEKRLSLGGAVRLLIDEAMEKWSAVS